MIYYNRKERSLKINLGRRIFYFPYNNGEEAEVVRAAYELADDPEFGLFNARIVEFKLTGRVQTLEGRI